MAVMCRAGGRRREVSINDYFTGGGASYASVGDIRDTAIDDYYGNPASGNSARDNGSVVFKPGAYW